MPDNNEADGPFPVLCAWCEKEGTRTVIGLSTVEGSHGICQQHLAGMREQAGLPPKEKPCS